MVDAKSLLHIDIVRMLTILSASKRISRANIHLCVLKTME